MPHASDTTRLGRATTRGLLALAVAGCNPLLGAEPLPGAEPIPADLVAPEAIWPVGSEACRACVEESQCVEETKACAASAQCLDAYACLRDSVPPVDPADMFRCRLGDWGTVSRDLLFCAAGCRACGLVEDMTCADRWDYPAPGTGEILTVELALRQANVGPIAGARVRVCSPGALGCEPIAEEISDDEGIASIPVVQGYPGFFEISAEGYALVYFYPQQDKTFWETRTPYGMWATDTVMMMPGFFVQRPDLGLVAPSMGSCFNPLQTSLDVSYAAPDAMTDDTIQTTINDIPFILNLQPGYHDVTAEVGGFTSTKNVQIAPGVTTVVRLLPRR